MHLYLLSFGDTSSDNGYRQFLVTANTLNDARNFIINKYSKQGYLLRHSDISGKIVQMGTNGLIREI